jgi:hypothetical protein
MGSAGIDARSAKGFWRIGDRDGRRTGDEMLRLIVEPGQPVRRQKAQLPNRSATAAVMAVRISSVLAERSPLFQPIRIVCEARSIK